MFGIGGQELILLMIIGLVVLGPERLPRIANQLGGWLGQARRMTRVMKRQLEEELDLNNIKDVKPPPSSGNRQYNRQKRRRPSRNTPCRGKTMIIHRSTHRMRSAQALARKSTTTSRTSLFRNRIEKFLPTTMIEPGEQPDDDQAEEKALS